ncbi:T9SS type A sorting domain-containing protein [Polaribacter litorisediminis]|uniref:glycosyl hydrolase n=1 Tax=Polaribacter litorisediminis TaxID=1908341 RepID=UPI001CBDC189|nr:glycosyl hydrolase [Polaribacter litorisediminis]UAM99522.1 T9SS type A sorting domain-containing protein [Polaribacter litorisediminis]
MKNYILFIYFILAFSTIATAQTTQVGSGSYANMHPGTDAAGRNGFPSGTPQLSGNAIGKPVPTNDWWSKLIKENHADNLFNYPMTMKTTNSGLIVTYIPFGVIGDSAPIEVGLTGLNAPRTTVSDYSDWTMTMNWKDNNHELKATSGIGMPFLYFEKDADDIVSIKVNSGSASITNEMLTIENASAGADFVFYAPLGSIWEQAGNVYTSTLNGKDYWSMAMLPQNTSNVNAVAQDLKKYAYVFPTNTETSWSYNESNSKVTTTFTTSVDVKEGTHSNMLLGLLPHQWYNLASNSPTPNTYEYSSIRGALKMLDGNTFTVENTYKGILPTIPYLANYSEGFSPSDLDAKISQIENDGLATWTDSYNEGQVMNRLIQTARIANQTGNIEARDKMIATIKERLEDWLSYESGEVAFLFYYNSDWSAMIGYPAGHGQDNNLNDHHFHWGYFIHAAAFMEQFDPGWAAEWGDMINTLIRDAASFDRNDTQFPFLRNYSPYAGHSWANGFATFPQGNDQESTSESMQFASSLIHWGTITENNSIRDLGIYIYTTEQTAIEEYWFDVYERNFQATQQYSLVSRVWGNSYDNGTFWTADIAASYGIEMYPIHGGSFYLGHNQEYSKKLWAEIESNTGVLSREDNDNLWHDTYWKYLSFTDPQKAVDLYNAYPERNLKFGVSDAQTYHWLHGVNAMGIVDATITADYPIAAVFKQNGETTYVAHNYSDSEITVSFSDGFKLIVPANQMKTSRDIDVSGVLSSDFDQAFPGGSVNLSATITGEGVTKVEFFDGANSIGETTTAPYQIKATNLTLGVHGFYAKVFVNNQFNVTNIVNIQVGEQVPYSGTPMVIPGVIEPGFYDKFQGGIGQNITYVDNSIGNNGNFRTEENVDANIVNGEGATVGELGAGEWMEYSIHVETAGIYDLSFRAASGNSSGGGPFYFEIEGNKISPSISVQTSNDWENWITNTATDIELTKGEHILRLFIESGEFNLGRMTFSYKSDLTFVPPVANAGENVSVLSPLTTATLDGSLSMDPEGETITYSWEQVYGPSIINFDSTTTVSPNISNLENGVYKCKLTVSDGTYSAFDEVLILVSAEGNLSPSISITSPSNGTTFKEGEDINITTITTDLDGTVQVVEFFDGTNKIGEDSAAPFTFVWIGASVGSHEITAIATDNMGAKTTSEPVTISVDEEKSCTETSAEAQQGNFSQGYEVNFETIGNSVTITFTLLDTNKVGVVAYLWQQNPFMETEFDEVSGLTFSKTIGGLTTGETISYAAKFAYAGGFSVTKYFQYVVGDSCTGSISDVTAPENFTASIGNITASSVELLLNATDESGKVVYEITYGNTIKTVNGDSGVQKSYIINDLEEETFYSFSVIAKDLSGNLASNNPLVLEATTLVNSNSECSGTDSEAIDGAFSIGYTYSFETNGSNVTITFELLDTDKTGVVAYLFRQSPFAETMMNEVSTKKFSQTVSGLTNGQTISYACKFAFAGGLAVTKYFSYTVGSNCTLSTEDTILQQSVKIFPNPSKNILNISSSIKPITKVEIYSVVGKKIIEFNSNLEKLNIQELSSGLYLIKISSEESNYTTKFIKE